MSNEGTATIYKGDMGRIIWVKSMQALNKYSAGTNWTERDSAVKKNTAEFPSMVYVFETGLESRKRIYHLVSITSVAENSDSKRVINRVKTSITDLEKEMLTATRRNSNYHADEGLSLVENISALIDAGRLHEAALHAYGIMKEAKFDGDLNVTHAADALHAWLRLYDAQFLVTRYSPMRETSKNLTYLTQHAKEHAVRMIALNRDVQFK